MLTELAADFNNEQINASQGQLEKALYLSRLLIALSISVKNSDRMACLKTAQNTTDDIDRHHRLDHLKGDLFWQHLIAYLESATRVTEEFIPVVQFHLFTLTTSARQTSPIFCFLHNELYFKESNVFYCIFRYLECESKLKDAPKKFGRKLEAFNELIALFNTGTDHDIQRRCKTFVTHYEQNGSLFVHRKGAFLNLLKSLSHQTQSIQNIATLKTELRDFCVHLAQQKAVVESVQKLTNIDSVMNCQRPHQAHP